MITQPQKLWILCY